MKARHERGLTTLVVLEAVALFVVAPLSAKRAAPLAVDVGVAVAIVASVLAVVWRSRAAVAAVILAS